MMCMLVTPLRGAFQNQSDICIHWSLRSERPLPAREFILHVCTHTRTHTHTHTHIVSINHSHIHTHTHTYAHTYIHTQSQAQAHSHPHAVLSPDCRRATWAAERDRELEHEQMGRTRRRKIKL